MKLSTLCKLQAQLDKMTRNFIRRKASENKALRGGIKAAEDSLFSNHQEMAKANAMLER